jgi:hypothetical protein
VRKSKKIVEGRVGRPKKRTEDRSMAHQEIVEGSWRKHTGSHTGTMSPRGSIRSGKTACTNNSDYDTGDDDLDHGSDQSRFSRLNSRVNSTETLNSQHASTSIYPNVAARRAMNRELEEVRARPNTEMMQGRIRKQEKMIEDRKREHQSTVNEFQRMQQRSQVPSCLDSAVIEHKLPLDYPTDWKRGTTRPEESSFRHPLYSAREAEYVEPHISLFDPDDCGCHFTQSGQVEPPCFDADVKTEWESFKHGRLHPNEYQRGVGIIVAPKRQSVSRSDQSGKKLGRE